MNTLGSTPITPVLTSGLTTTPARAAAPKAEAAEIHLEPRDVAIALPQSLASVAPSAAPTVQAADHDWSTGAKVAAITAGVIGGAAVAGAVAFGLGVGGVHLGSLVLGGMYQEPLAASIALGNLAQAAQVGMVAAPVVGAIGGGIVGGIAAHQKQAHVGSSVPGGTLAHNDVDAAGGPLNEIKYDWRAVKTQFREAGNKVHEGVEGVHHAGSLGEAVASGAQAGKAFGARMGQAGGRIIGIAEGVALGALMAGMPFTFAPVVAIPAAIVGAFGASEIMAKVGEVAAGLVGGAGGAVAGAVAHGIHRATGSESESAKAAEG